MVIINDFSLDPSFTLLNINATLDTGSVCSSLKLYIGSDYLSETKFIDLTALAGSTESISIELSIDDPLLTPYYNKEVFDGVFTIVVESDAATDNIAEAILLNAFYSSICIANMVIAHDDVDEWNELNMVYLLLQAAITYAQTELIEQAVGAYEKVEAICKAKGDTFLNTNISECGQGLGCWIVNGVYVVKR